MATKLTLPDVKEVLKVESAVRKITDEGRLARNSRRVEWLITFLHLQGIRDFNLIDYANGTVSTTWHNRPYYDRDHFVYEGLLSIHQAEFGRLLQLDLSPVVGRRGLGLDGLKKSSTAQVILDSMLTPERVLQLSMDANSLFVKTGHVGVGSFIDDDGEPFIEIIPPWELIGIPAIPISSQEVSGIGRIRWVTIEWLKDRKLLPGSKDIDRMQVREIPRGHEPDNQTSVSFNASGVARDMPGARRGAKPNSSSQMGDTLPESQKWVELVEIWVEGQADTLERYVATVGSVRIRDISYRGEKKPKPVWVARYIDSGGFYGRGPIAPLIQLNEEVSFMLEQLFDNVENFDLFGFLCVGTDMGISRETISEARRGDKVLMYEVDPMSEGNKPFVLTPGNAGKFPGEIAKMALGLIEANSQLSPLLQGDAPGRVDSARALSFLQETSNIPLSSPTESLSAAFSGAYKSLLWIAKETWPERKVVEMTLMDDMLVGIRFDPRTGEVALDRDSVPNANEVRITVSSKEVRTRSQEIAELKESLGLGVITPREYRFKVREQGLSIPVGNEVEWQNYRRAKLQNVVLFNDGTIPGEVLYSENDLHEIYVEVLLSFMARPEYQLASEDVRSAFEQSLDQHREALGQLPEGLEPPGESPGSNVQMGLANLLQG